ncbi:MAG: 50S ribosomal protein L3 [Patescibacteria group bacterium]|nr:50S ribosomal protein L3 [Patescibacteria group bacterium]
MKFIIGKKIEMTQLWQGENVAGVTAVQAGPCYVTQVKTTEKDGYQAVQLGFGGKKEKNTNKPQIGHLKNIKTKGIDDNFAWLREFRVDAKSALEIGDKIDVGAFAIGDKVAATGVSKGRGFQGVVKRHGFSGGRKSHGNKDQLRMPGSTGATGAGHVFKGTKKPGRMGTETVTTKNLEIIEIDKEKNILYIKGGIAGARNGLVLIEGAGDIVASKPAVAVKEEIKPAEAAAEAEKK